MILTIPGLKREAINFPHSTNKEQLIDLSQDKVLLGRQPNQNPEYRTPNSIFFHNESL